jgi:hypothetical protein
MNDSSDGKSNKKSAKMSEASRKITKGNQSQVEEGRGGARQGGFRLIVEPELRQE